MLERINPIFAILAAILLTIIVYMPGLNGEFYFDDTPNIEENFLLHIKDLQLDALWQAMWSGQAGVLKRPISMLSFAINHYFFGLSPFAMKVINLIIHLINGVLIFLLINFLFKNVNIKNQTYKHSKYIAYFIVIVWLIHPINLTNVLYVIQRMNSLSALFSLLAIIFYCNVRRRQFDNKGRWLSLILLPSFFGILAILSKENAILLPYFILCIEIFIFKFKSVDQHTENKNKIIIYSATIFPGLALFITLILNLDWFERAYEFRDFTITERLLSQSRILIWYMRMIVAPDLTQLSLFVEFSPLSTSIFSPISTLLSLVVLASIIILAIKLKNSVPLFSFGVFWFFVGHALESSIIPLELIFEHRNYLPSLGLIIAIISVMDLVFKYISKINFAKIALPLAWLLILSITTHARANQWENSISLALVDVHNYPNSSRANIYAGLAYTRAAVGANDISEKNNFSKQADEFFLKAIDLEKDGFSATFGRIISFYLINKPINNEIYSNLTTMIRKKPISASTQSAILTFINCKIENVCKIEDPIFLKLINHSVNNPTLPKKFKASQMIALSKFYIKNKNDPNKAIDLVKNAILEDKDNIRYHLVLVNWYYQSRQIENAWNELEIFKNKDKFKFNRYDIHKWQTILESYTL